MQYQILRGDCIEQMRALPGASFDAIVTDPPYELGFMGKSWDASGIAYSTAMWCEALRVLKPGGHLLAFSGSRTYHRMTCAIEDAGFEVRDQIMWVYGSGFPKSLDVSKAIDKARDDRDDILAVTTFMADAADLAGITRADVDAAMGTSDMGGWWLSRLRHRCQCPKWEQWLQLKVLLSLSDEMDAEVWRLNGRKGTPGEAWGEREVIGQDTKARSTSGNSALPTVGGETIYKSWDITAPATDAARQWEGWGTALKPAHEPICVARKPLAKGATVAANVLAHGTGAINIDGCRVGMMTAAEVARSGTSTKADGWGMAPRSWKDEGKEPQGRWPANLIHDGSDEVVSRFPDSKGTANGGTAERNSKGSEAYWGEGGGGFKGGRSTVAHADTGSAARFFYCAKASKSDRGPNNTHPTVKPLALMQYLCRLVTPPGGRILDPFAGSGSTIVAALREGFTATGIELLDDHAAIIEGRLDEELYGDII